MNKDILLEPNSRKILDLILLDYMTEFYVREIARKTKLSLGKVSELLNQLEKEAILVSRTVGKIKFYKANLNSVKTKQYKIFSNVLNAVDMLSPLFPFTDTITLFGSCAKGENHAESDIDLFIITDKKDKIKEAIYNIRNKENISPIIHTFAEYVKLKKTNTDFTKKIERGIVLWNKEEASNSMNA